MLYSFDQQPNELRENINLEQEKYQQAIKTGKPLKEAKKIFRILKAMRQKLQRQASSHNGNSNGSEV
jgi:hypothetical protein